MNSDQFNESRMHHMRSRPSSGESPASETPSVPARVADLSSIGEVMKYIIIGAACLALFVGCASVSTEDHALRFLDSLQVGNTPATKEIVIEGKRWTVAKMGIALADPDLRLAFASLAMAYAEKGRWPNVDVLPTPSGDWTVRRFDDVLIASSPGGDRELLLTSDAYLSVDEKMIPFLNEIDGALRSGRSSRLPVVPVLPAR